MSWAEDAKVTWTTGATGGFDSAADPTTITTDISYSVGAGLTESGTQTFDGTTYTKFNQNTGDNKGSNSHDNGVSLKKYVDFKFTPVGGKFTPTKVSFNMIKIGTGDPNVYVDVIDGAGATINVADNKTIIKNDAAAGTSTAHEYNVSGAATSDGAVTLRIIVGKLASGKSVGITNVKIEGTIETGGGTPAPAEQKIAAWAVTTAPAVGTAFQVEDAIQVAFGKMTSNAADANATNYVLGNASVSVTYSGTKYNFTKYATTSKSNGRNSSDLAADGPSEGNYISFVPK